jgi:nucleoside-diphosphate-sugar epimerase
MGSGVVLVNGAGGFLGSSVVEALCASGLEVRATDLPGTDLAPARRAEAEVKEADLLDPGSLPRLFDGVTRVANIAGLFNYALPWEVLQRANVGVTRNMCAAALEAGVSRFVHISSIAVYGRPVSAPMKEDHPKNAANNYERSKREGEGVVDGFAGRGLPAVTLRPAGIYGPRSRYGQAAFMALLALIRHSGRRKIPVMRGGPRMQHVHVEDVAGAVKAVLDAPAERVKGRAFNVSDDTPLGQGELFEAVMPGLDLAPLIHYPYFTRAYWPFIRALLALPESSFGRMNGWFKQKWEGVVKAHGLEPALAPRLDRDFLSYMNADYALDNSALKALGYQLKHPDARQGLAEALRWYQDHKWLPRF